MDWTLDLDQDSDQDLDLDLGPDLELDNIVINVNKCKFNLISFIMTTKSMFFLRYKFVFIS